MMFRNAVVALLERAGVPGQMAASELELPKDSSLGDFAFPCFLLAKQHKKSPAIIAKDIASNIKPVSPVARVENAGPYVNFFIDNNILGQKVISTIISQGSLLGSGSPKDERIMVEYPAPNTNKPLHLGHVRNMLLGSSICNILGFAGYKVIPVNLVNDRGIHICKSMLAYKKWGSNLEPDKKTDHFVGDYYVLFNKNLASDPSLEGQAQEMLAKWEAGDPETIALWNKMRKWALDGHSVTYKDFDVHHKKTYYESDLYRHGREIIEDGLKGGLFNKDESGAIYADLDRLGRKYLLRADGTSIYITQDIYLAKLKFDDFQMNRSVHVVGSEQMHHFQVLFKILELLGYSFARNCYHLSYGMVYLPEGKMKSREGVVVDADDLTSSLLDIAREEVAQRHEGIDEIELFKRSKAISMAALKFFFLKYDALKDFTYNPEESISFEGETGPYIQYAHARICSIFRAAGNATAGEGAVHSFTHPAEGSLIKLLANYPEIITEAADKYNPGIVARYALLVAQGFSTFYTECPILKAERQVMESRLALCHAARIVLQSSLSLLGIEAPEEM